MTARTIPKVGGPDLPRENLAALDECGLVFHVLEAQRNPGIMIDVGAHYGSSLAPFARASWQVFAFEPDSANRARLHENIAAAPRRFAKVTVSPKAVSDEVRDDVAFFSSPVSTGISGLSAFHESHSQTDRVSTTTLDHVVSDHALGTIDFLKIDVEGHEMSVLSGLDFEAVKPRAIVAEFEDAKTRPNGYSTTDLAQFFVERGYTVYVSEWYPIETYGVRHQWRRLARWPTDIADHAWGNLVALLEPPESHRLDEALRKNVGYPKSFFVRLIDRIRRRLSLD